MNLTTLKNIMGKTFISIKLHILYEVRWYHGKIRPYMIGTFFIGRSDFMRIICFFILTFFFIFLIYQLFILKKYKKGKTEKQLSEVNYLIYRYHIDMEKINYKKLLNVISIVSSLDVTILVTITFLFDNTIIQLLVALLLTIPIVVSSYGLIGRYYKKKGLVKNV